MMRYYSEIRLALDFAIKCDATAVTIEMDAGDMTLSPRKAEEIFDGLEIGEPFSLKAIYFEEVDSL